jgi:hypothetical protein
MDRYPGSHVGSVGAELEQIIHDLAVDGADEIVRSDRQPGGAWAALVRDGPELVRRVWDLWATGDLDVPPEAIDSKEWTTLEQAAGVIVLREGEAEVSVQAYGTEEDLAAAWTAILAEFTPDEPGSAAIQSPEADDNPT